MPNTVTSIIAASIAGIWFLLAAVSVVLETNWVTLLFILLSFALLIWQEFGRRALYARITHLHRELHNTEGQLQTARAELYRLRDRHHDNPRQVD